VTSQDIETSSLTLLVDPRTFVAAVAGNCWASQNDDDLTAISFDGRDGAIEPKEGNILLENAATIPFSKMNLGRQKEQLCSERNPKKYRHRTKPYNTHQKYRDRASITNRKLHPRGV
jgi:hypothetical protein